MEGETRGNLTFKRGKIATLVFSYLSEKYTLENLDTLTFTQAEVFNFYQDTPTNPILEKTTRTDIATVFVELEKYGIISRGRVVGKTIYFHFNWDHFGSLLRNIVFDSMTRDATWLYSLGHKTNDQYKLPYKEAKSLPKKLFILLFLNYCGDSLNGFLEKDRVPTAELFFGRFTKVVKVVTDVESVYNTIKNPEKYAITKTGLEDELKSIKKYLDFLREITKGDIPFIHFKLSRYYHKS